MGDTITETRLFRVPCETAKGPFGEQRQPAYMKGVASFGVTEDAGDSFVVYVVGAPAALDAIQTQPDVKRI